MSGPHIVDAHHHLWDPADRAYPWMAGEGLAPLRRRFDATDLAAAAAGTPVGRTVAVQAVGTVEETRWLLEVAAADGLVAGVIGWVDLTAPDVADQLAALQGGPGGDRLVGIRHQVQDELDPEWLLRADVQRGLRGVADAGLAYDLLVLTPQLPAAIRCVAALPDVRWVLDHGAKPPIAGGGWQPWADRLRELAGHASVTCKLSGLVTEAAWDRWTPAGIRPYAEVLLDAFGADRLMWGSDWPVCLLAAPYEQVHGLAAELLADLSADERAAVWAGTAVRTYGLSPA